MVNIDLKIPEEWFASEIRGNAVGVHARVLDQGDVQIKTSEHAIYIQAPSGMSPQEAVHSPE